MYVQSLGNSLALVIDKSIRAVLGITRNTVLEVSTDGRRIIVIPLASPEREWTPIGDAFEIMKELVNHYGMRVERFAKLHENERMWSFWAKLHSGQETNDDDKETMRRMHHCLGMLRLGAEWDEATREALRMFPQRPRNHTASAMAEAKINEMQPQIT